METYRGLSHLKFEKHLRGLIMKKLLFTMVLGLGILTSNAQIQKLAGPRIGITMVTPGLLANILKKDVSFFSDENRESWDGTSLGEYGAVMSQYGWQWESRFAEGGGSVTGIVEWIALVGGMEQGLFLPSISSIIGARTTNGLEFGVGPNLSLSGIGMVFGVGYNFKSGDLNLPVNLVIMPGKDVKGGLYNSANNTYEDYTYNTGARISIMVGFNMSR